MPNRTQTAEERRASDLAFMQNPFCWPNMFLPLKRSPGTYPGANLAVLIDPRTPTLYLINLFAIADGAPELRTCPTIHYSSLEEILDDGWTVD